MLPKKAVLRRLISRLTESINQAYDGASPSDEIIAGAEKALIDVSENANRSGFKNIRDILNINFGSLKPARFKPLILRVLRQAIAIWTI